MKLKTHKLKPEECRFAVMDVDEEEYGTKGVSVFIMPFDEYHEAFDCLSDDSLLNPPNYLVDADWIMENTCVIEDGIKEAIKSDMLRLGFVYDEELEE